MRIFTLWRIADYILIPYKNTAQSSGVISYASQFCVPVIGPAEGLLGNLIRKFDMGLCIENPNSYAMAEMFNEGKYLQADINKEGANKYLNICTPQSFVSHLLALNNK